MKIFLKLWNCPQVLGHEIVPDDVRLMYTFDGGERTDKYEAHSDNDVLILLDCTPDQVGAISLLRRGLHEMCSPARPMLWFFK
jgi:hypothetical protein